PESLASAVAASPVALLDVQVLSGQVEQVLPPVGRPVRGQLELSGKLLTPSAEIAVTVGRAGGETSTWRYELDREAATRGWVVARLWAQQKAAQLAAFPKRNATELVALGKRYNLVTPGTSMIVLERLEQYVE